jgi:hypothetical protein
VDGQRIIPSPVGQSPDEATAKAGSFRTAYRREPDSAGHRYLSEGENPVSYDQKCYDLAQSFLEETSVNAPGNRCQLAQRIQDEIEDFIQAELGKAYLAQESEILLPAGCSYTPDTDAENEAKRR